MVGLVGDRNVLTYIQTLEGLKSVNMNWASVIATQQGKSGEAARNYVKDVYLYADGVNTPVASLDGEAGRFTVEFYVGEEGKVTFEQEYDRSELCLFGEWYELVCHG